MTLGQPGPGQGTVHAQKKQGPPPKKARHITVHAQYHVSMKPWDVYGPQFHGKSMTKYGTTKHVKLSEIRVRHESWRPGRHPTHEFGSCLDHIFWISSPVRHVTSGLGVGWTYLGPSPWARYEARPDRVHLYLLSTVVLKVLTNLTRWFIANAKHVILSHTNLKRPHMKNKAH